MLVIRQRFTNLAKNRLWGRDCRFFPDFVRISHHILLGDGLDWGYWGVCEITLAVRELRNAELLGDLLCVLGTSAFHFSFE